MVKQDLWPSQIYACHCVVGRDLAAPLVRDEDPAGDAQTRSCHPLDGRVLLKPPTPIRRVAHSPGARWSSIVIGWAGNRVPENDNRAGSCLASRSANLR